MAMQDVLDRANATLTMEDLETLTDDIVNNLPPIDYISLRDEMSSMCVAIKENPTTFDINEGLAKSQAYRDRLVDIYILAYEHYQMRKRTIDMLIDANNMISKASSADKRRGEATLKYPMQMLNYEYAGAFLKEVEQKLNNMKNIFDMYSRQGTMLALQSNLGEYKANKNTDISW